MSCTLREQRHCYRERMQRRNTGTVNIGPGDRPNWPARPTRQKTLRRIRHRHFSRRINQQRTLTVYIGADPFRHNIPWCGLRSRLGVVHQHPSGTNSTRSIYVCQTGGRSTLNQLNCGRSTRTLLISGRFTRTWLTSRRAPATALALLLRARALLLPACNLLLPGRVCLLPGGAMPPLACFLLLFRCMLLLPACTCCCCPLRYCCCRCCCLH